ncbi:hypothetical protein FQN54_002855 [Arachnomyces sp. PD_36]|nr:hypothetical protein FQN54_002855 [Arachnomyces sp. PD_36]
MALTSQPITTSLIDVDKERADILTRLISKALHYGIDKGVFAEIIYDTSTRESGGSVATGILDAGQRIETSQESKNEAHELCNPELVLSTDLRLNAKTVQLYQEAPLNSPSFNMHLLELIAIAVHEVAGNVYAAAHRDRRPHAPSVVYGGVKSTLLSVDRYQREELYPNGIIDVVGYWAEARIFGGVVVPARGPEVGARNCFGIYISPPGKSDLFELSLSQIEEFVSRGNDRDNSLTLALPFTCQPEAERVDPLKAIRELNIYRDVYELERSGVEPYFEEWCGGARRM